MLPNIISNQYNVVCYPYLTPYFSNIAKGPFRLPLAQCVSVGVRVYCACNYKYKSYLILLDPGTAKDYKI